jgi:hypothetical protein
VKEPAFNRPQEPDDVVEILELGSFEPAWLVGQAVLLNEPLQFEQPFGPNRQFVSFLLKQALIVRETDGQPMTLLRPIDRPMPLRVKRRLP